MTVAPNQQVNLPYGLLDGRLVHVEDVQTGLASGCVCPGCGARLVAKNAGEIREHHFSHSTGSESCGEGWLHATAKLLLAERFRLAISSSDPVPIEYSCFVCPCTHPGNIIKGVDSVNVEEVITEAGIRPDILLRGTYPKVIEIVHTHMPEDPVLAFAKKESMPLVIIRVGCAADLESIRNEPLVPEIRNGPKVCLCEVKVRELKPRDMVCIWRWCRVCQQVFRLTAEGHRHCSSCGQLLLRDDPKQFSFRRRCLRCPNS